MTTIYGISNCDTIKKARAWLQSQGVEYDFHDYKKQGCDAKLAQLLLSKFDLDKVINKRGTSWRKLDDDTKENLTAKNAAVLMQENSSLIKRPILQHGKSWLIGFDENQWRDTLL